MKGILIIGFRKSPGAFLEAQYPPNISSDLNIEPEDLMNIYALHRMRQTDPNYQRIKLKKHYFASFYTGFSVKKCIGFPDKIVTTILSGKEEQLSSEFEGILKRFALEVLQNINNPLFGEILMDNYRRLKKGELQPYIVDPTKKEESHSVPVVSSGVLTAEQISNVIDSVAVELDELNFVDQFEELEEDEELAEIDKLRDYIAEQELVQHTLAEQILDHNIREEAYKQETQTLKEHILSQNDKINELIQKMISLTEQKVDISQHSTELKEKIGQLRVLKTEEQERLQLVAELKEKIIILEEQTKDLKKSISVLESDKKELLKQVAKVELLTKNNENLEKANKELKQMIEKLQTELATLQQEVKTISQPSKTLEKIPEKLKGKAPLTEKAKAEDLSVANGEGAIREKWLLMDLNDLEKELNNINMNDIRTITIPWDLKPKGRKKVDLINAVLDYIKNKK